MDWSKSMQQTYEFYKVDPYSWRDIERLTNVKSCTITRDPSVETLGSASFDIIGNIGECYVRVYLVSVQNEETDRRPLGTFLVQTPSNTFNGKYSSVSVDAYTPLLELKENLLPIGYTIRKNKNVLDNAYQIMSENMRAPVIRTYDEKKLDDDFVANTEDSWLTYSKDLVATASYELDVDELGQILYKPVQSLSALSPVWTYNDDKKSILYPEITVDRDLYGIPNVVEVIYSGTRGTYYGKAENNDDNSPVSINNRGREIIYRLTNPETYIMSKTEANNYAKKVLKSLSSLEYTVKYSHGFCPARVGDCVLLNYERAGLVDVKAKITMQSITCSTGCKVSETAVFTEELWR